MRRKPFKILCILSAVLFVLLVLFTLFVWLLANVGGILFLMLTMGNAEVQLGGISLAEFLENFVGSPLFYIFLADILIFVLSVIGLIVTKNKNRKTIV